MTETGLVHPPVTDPSARQDRLDALSDWERALLLAYLDGRIPGYVDEWFEKRARVTVVLPGGYTSAPGLAEPPAPGFGSPCER